MCTEWAISEVNVTNRYSDRWGLEGIDSADVYSMRTVRAIESGSGRLRDRMSVHVHYAYCKG